MRNTILLFAPLLPGETLGYSVLVLEQNPVFHFIGILCPEEERECWNQNLMNSSWNLSLPQMWKCKHRQ